MTQAWPNGLTERLTQGGVWHPVHRRECLTILLGTYAENGNAIGTDDELHCIRYSLLTPCASASPFLPIGICRSKSNQQPMNRRGSFRVSETVPCTNNFLCSGIPYVLYQFLKYMRDSTSNKCSERVNPFFQDQSYGGRQGDNVGGCHYAGISRLYRIQCSSSSVDCIVHFRRTR